MIAYIINGKELNPLVTELSIRGTKLNISIVFITQYYFKVPKEVIVNTTHFFIMKILKKRELHRFLTNHSSDVDFNVFMKIYKKYTAEPYSFLVNDTTLPSDNLSRLRKNVLKQTYKSLLLMIRLKMKNYNTILIERLQKHQPYHQTKLIIMYILQVKKYYFLIKNK